MNKYRNDFTIRFAELMQNNLLVWKELQKHERRSLYNKESIGGYLFAALLAMLPGKREREYNLELHCVMSVIFFIGAIFINIGIKNKSYQDEIKRTLFPKLLQVFDRGITYKFCTIRKELFNVSELFKKEVTSKSFDDYFGGTYNEVEFCVAEATLENVKQVKKQKPETTELFKGVAMRFKMNKQINSRIIIRSKSLFNRTPKGYERVQLEYEKFNKKFDVWVKKVEGDCTEQVEARYLLNVSFLERFMELKTSFRVSKMACSVYGDTILVLLNTGKDVFEMNHLFGRLDDPCQYKKLFDEFASVLSFIDVLNLASKTKL
jgi:hypothetical protein